MITVSTVMSMNIMMYERYIDDSNQVAVVPPPGAKYDTITKKMIIDDNLVDTDIELSEDERTAKVMTDIANSVMTGIVMVFDVPSRNADKKMPIRVSLNIHFLVLAQGDPGNHVLA